MNPPRAAIALADSPDFARDLAAIGKRHPDAAAAVDAVFAQEVLPALAEAPLLPSRMAAGAALGRQCFKRRVAIGGQGKRGALRVIYHWDPAGRRVTRLLAFAKSDQDTVPDGVIAAALRRAGLE